MLRSKRMRRACVIVAKAPVPGAAKTRLVPPLTHSEAAELYRAFLLDAVDLATGLGWERVSAILPHGSRDALSQVLPETVDLVEQRDRGLAGALSEAFEHHLDHGFERVVLIASDSPTLEAAPIRAACDALGWADLAIGPTHDGGYYLLAMRRFHRAIFEGIDWSTPRVYEQTVAQARSLGWLVETVTPWYDVDEPADLERLRDDLGVQPPHVAQHTRRALSVLSAPAR